MAHKYNVYIDEYSYKAEYKPKKIVGCTNIGYHRVVLADSRSEALEKCLSDIKKELYKLDGKYASVWVGKVGSITDSASRLSPMQVVIATGKIRV